VHVVDKQAAVYIAGHRGLVGAALVRRLSESGYRNLILKDKSELDLRCQAAVNRFFARMRPKWVFLAAAKVGGIYANQTSPAEFIYDNTMIQANVIQAAYQNGVEKLLFLGSSCIYPRLAPQPLREDYLLTGLLEPTNEAYAIAKIMGIKMCQAYNRQYGTNFIAVMPANLYGPNDHFGTENSHVIAALITKLHQAKCFNLPEVQLWGSGNAMREFIYVDDLAAACMFLMENYHDSQIINAGSGVDISIRGLAFLIKKVIGYQGDLGWDRTMPDGMPRKLLDVTRINALGWRPQISLEDGMRLTYQWFLDQAKT
jgi:GDP-L-fucose synthase